MADIASTQGRRMFSIEAAYAEGDPYADYAWFRRNDPVHVGAPGWPLGHPTVFLFRHDDVMRWLSDSHMIKRAGHFPEVQAQRQEQAYAPPERDTFGYMASRFMLLQDPPDHTRLRGLANRAFTPRV